MEPMSVPPTVLAPPPCLHLDPPATPASFFADRRRLLIGVIAAFGFLAASAAISNAWLLMQWDKPIQKFIESNRNGTLDTVFLTVSRFGSTIVVLSVGSLLTLLTWRRCRAVAIAILVAMLARPLLEFTFKELVNRDRPNLDRMVNGVGYSFPSGHPMAAIALWGMLPVVVGLFTTRRAVWWATVVLSACMIVGIGMSRVYLGVHWVSDVVGGLLLGAIFLLGIEWVMHRAHGLTGCAAAHAHVHAETRFRERELV